MVFNDMQAKIIIQDTYQHINLIIQDHGSPRVITMVDYTWGHSDCFESSTHGNPQSPYPLSLHKQPHAIANPPWNSHGGALPKHATKPKLVQIRK